MSPVSKRRIALFLAAVFAMTAVCAAVVMTWQYRSYCDKMDIIYTLTGAEAAKADTDAASAVSEGISESASDSASDGSMNGGAEDTSGNSSDNIRYDSPVLSAAADILKGNGADTDYEGTGRELLAAYGYGIPAGSADRRMPDSYQSGLYRSWAVTAAVSAAVFLAVTILFLFFVRKETLQQENGLLEVAEILSGLQSGDYDAPARRRLAGSKGAFGILDDRLESLAEHLSYARAASEKEKESTKSLVTDLSHQLKTPVAAMGTSLEVLKQEGLTEEERREFTERCLKQEERLKDLLGALINISRLESGMIELKFTEARLMDTVAAAVSRIYPVASAKNISVSVDAAEELSGIVIRQDPKWLSEALLNVLENAVKYSPENTEIQIRISKLVTFLRVEVEDEGIGIPKKERHRVFQRFYRGGDAGIQEQPGSGVGLYLTRRIVEAHGGMIRAADAVKNVKSDKMTEESAGRSGGGRLSGKIVKNAAGNCTNRRNRGGTTFIIQLPLKDI